MNKKSIIRKLTSRKLWIAVVGIAVGIASAFGITENEWAQVAGVVTTALSVLAYITGEATIDAKNKDGAETLPKESEQNK